MTQSWMEGVGSCIRYGGGWNQSSCSYAYNTVTGSPGSGTNTINSCNDVNNQFAQYYRVYVPGAYAVNGVCHQATNRALWGTHIPWTHQLPIGGAGASYNAFGNCGTYYPYGLGLPNCKFHV